MSPDMANKLPDPGPAASMSPNMAKKLISPSYRIISAKDCHTFFHSSLTLFTSIPVQTSGNKKEKHLKCGVFHKVLDIISICIDSSGIHCSIFQVILILTDDGVVSDLPPFHPSSRIKAFRILDSDPYLSC